MTLIIFVLVYVFFVLLVLFFVMVTAIRVWPAVVKRHTNADGRRVDLPLLAPNWFMTHFDDLMLWVDVSHMWLGSVDGGDFAFGVNSYTNVNGRRVDLSLLAADWSMTHFDGRGSWVDDSHWRFCSIDRGDFGFVSNRYTNVNGRGVHLSLLAADWGITHFDDLVLWVDVSHMRLGSVEGGDFGFGFDGGGSEGHAHIKFRYVDFAIGATARLRIGGPWLRNDLIFVFLLSSLMILGVDDNITGLEGGGTGASDWNDHLLADLDGRDVIHRFFEDFQKWEVFGFQPHGFWSLGTRSASVRYAVDSCIQERNRRDTV